MEQIYATDYFSELEKTVKSIDEKVLRKELAEQYLRLVEYTNAAEWNRQKMNPIVFGGIFTHHTRIESNMLFPMLRDLRKRFDRNLKPESYGDGVNRIAIRYITAEQGEKRTTCFERGTYYPKKESYDCEIFIGEEFAEMTESRRKEQIKHMIQEILETLKEKLRKNKQKYNIDLLTADAMYEVDKWINKK